MGEHKCRAGVKGDGYKAKQKIQNRRRYIKAAHVTEKWMLEHGYTQGEDGKWRLS